LENGKSRETVQGNVKKKSKTKKIKDEERVQFTVRGREKNQQRGDWKKRQVSDG